MTTSSGLNTQQDLIIKQMNFTFDSRGLFIYRQFLSTEELDNARNVFDGMAFVPETWTPDQHRVSNIHNSTFQGLARRLHESAVTRRLIGYPHRLLESYAIKRTAGRLDLHGGASEFVADSSVKDISARSWVQDQQIYTLRLKVLLYLDDVASVEDGPFLYVEGSHKSAFSFHRAFGGGRGLAADFTRNVELKAGDALWLNEALLHGAGEKTSMRSRRLLAFTYGPTFMADWATLASESLTDAGYFASETEHAE
jgi:Phytanoyl-CoA dioxygenase (PhyH)